MTQLAAQPTFNRDKPVADQRRWYRSQAKWGHYVRGDVQLAGLCLVASCSLGAGPESIQIEAETDRPCSRPFSNVRPR